jgi:uncharacterized PurR-regulated membrane protein YhhQ (DUF165 family)
MKRLGLLAITAYILSIVLANWAIHRFGFVPVGFGLLAPAGAYFAGAVFVARDCIQLTLGRWWVLPAIAIGALISWQTSASLALASGVAFFCGEMMDWVVFTPLRAKGQLALAFLLGNTFGLVLDSLLFLWLAFHSLSHWQGLSLGKFWMTVPACAATCLIRRRAVLPRHT